MGNGDFGGGARLGTVAVTLAVAAGVVTGSDSQARALSLATPSVSVTTPLLRAEVPSVTVDAPRTQVEIPRVTAPRAPIEPPTVQIKPPAVSIEPPSAPVAPRSLPVKPPSVRIEAPAVPGSRPLPSTRGLPTDPSPRPPQPGGSPGGGGSATDQLSAGIPASAGLPSGSEWARLSPDRRRELVRRAFDTPLREAGLRRLRRTVQAHGGCLGALSDRGRRTLELRAGLFGREPASRREIARRIGVSPLEVPRIERSSLRRLVSAGGRGHCDGGMAAAAAASEWAATGTGGPAATSPGDDVTGNGGEPTPEGNVLADVAESGPGIALGDGEQDTAETLLFFLLALFALLAPLAAAAVAAQRRAANAATATGEAARPLLFLDVDGVIALSSAAPPGRVRVAPVGYIYLPDRAGGLVRRLERRFDVVWATGWEHQANAYLLGPLGLREELPVVTFGRKARYGSSDWKLKRVNAYARNRPAAWLDDNFEDCHERWAADRALPTLLVPVDPRAGLTEDHVERLLGWADAISSAASPSALGTRPR